MLTTQEVADLAGCGIDPVLRALNRGEILGAKREIVKKSIAWQIPDEAGRKWAKNYVPHARQKVKRPFGPMLRTANKQERTPPAIGSIPVTRDDRPLNGAA